jgi:molecular chaperone GrpE
MTEKKTKVTEEEKVTKEEAAKEEAMNEDQVLQAESNEDNFEEKYNELNNRFLRLYSEFDNYKRRTAKERLELLNTAGEQIMIALLPSFDDFDRAIKANEETQELNVIKEGVSLVYNKLKSTLEQKGLENMDSLHKTFDTDNHEALTNIPAPKKKLKGKVVDVIEKGYFLNGKVIRHAKVVVGN